MASIFSSSVSVLNFKNLFCDHAPLSMNQTDLFFFFGQEWLQNTPLDPLSLCRKEMMQSSCKGNAFQFFNLFVSAPWYLSLTKYWVVKTNCNEVLLVFQFIRLCFSGLAQQKQALVNLFGCVLGVFATFFVVTALGSFSNRMSARMNDALRLFLAAQRSLTSHASFHTSFLLNLTYFRPHSTCASLVLR